MMDVLIVAVLVLLSPGDPVGVTLPEKAGVPFARLHLGDIATLEGGDAVMRDRLAGVDLGRGPRLGFPRVISRTGLASYLTSLGVARESFSVRGAPACRVSLRTAMVSQDEILAAAREFVRRERPAEEGERLVFQPTTELPDVQVPSGSGGYEIEVSWASSASVSGVARMRVTLLVDGRPFDSVPVDFQVRRFATVLVAEQSVARDADLGRAPLVLREQEITRLRGTPIRSLAQVAGHRSRRALSAGRVVMLEDTIVPPVVKRSDLVTIVYRKAGLSVETRGFARADGAPGEVITVMNIDSNRPLRCRIEGPGVVSVLH